MPTFENPSADANEVQTVLRALAHATRSIEDPRQIYSVLESLTSAVASLSQSLHQLAAFHDGAATAGAWVADDSRSGRAAAYQVSWELHRAGETLRQISGAIEHAHDAEAQITYVSRDFQGPSEPAHGGLSHGLGR